MARVLVIDDDLGIRETSRAVLRQAGHEVGIAASGTEALRILQRDPYDVLVIDFNLPDMTALDLIRTLRGRGMATPSVIVTGFGTIESAVEAIKLGAIDYLQKPLAGDDLELAIKRALAGGTDYAPGIIRADGVARWSMAIASVLTLPHDPKNLTDWSRIRGVAPETLRSWCRTARLSPKRSLDLARILRAVSQARAQGWSLDRLLNIANHRTLERLLARSGLATATDLPAIEELLHRQRFITDPGALEELRRVLAEFGLL